jgi:hypothetical protein
MADELKPPIILLGNVRSGTTILQQLVAEHPAVEKWYEPRTVWLYADPGRRHDEFDESDATPKVKRYVREQFLKFQKQHDNCTIVEKTPINVLKIPYVRAIFPEAYYLYLVRNPFSFLSSVEMKWQAGRGLAPGGATLSRKGLRRRLQTTPISQLHHYAIPYIVHQFERRILRRKYVSIWGPRYRGIHEDLKSHDLLTVIARQWAVCSRKAEEDLARFRPGEVLRVRYEDFVLDPIRDLERICAHCRLELTRDMAKAARESVKPDRQLKWQRLDPRDVARIIPEVEDEMKRHGYTVPKEIAEAMEAR